LILLCLLRAPAAIPCVLRQSDEDAVLQVLDVPSLARELCSKEVEGASFLREFVALMTLVGNDFVPPLSFLRVGSGGVQHLLKAYSETRQSGAGPLVGDDGDLNLRRLAVIVQCLVRLEANGLAVLKEKHAARRAAMLQGAMLSVMTFEEFDSHRSGWRAEYYAHLFPRSIQASAVALDFLHGLRWVTHYYMRGAGSVDWTWAYPHMHSPTCQDLANFLHLCKSEDTMVGTLGPLPWLTPELQLLAVLPPEHTPAHLHHISTDLGLGCVHMFPTQFQLDGFLKTQAWQCHARLPRLDVDKLRHAINQSVASLPP
jgi:5'-3' exonuclease